MTPEAPISGEKTCLDSGDGSGAMSVQAAAMADQSSICPRIAVVVSSTGRPECLAFLWNCLREQTLLANRVVFSVTGAEDLPDLDTDEDFPEVIMSEKGLPRQRNRGLEAVLSDSDYVAFFDDDYVPSKYALEGLVRAFECFPDANGLTGQLLSDGIGGPGVSLDDAASMVRTHDMNVIRDDCAVPPQILRRLSGLYGCNMAYRTSAIGETRFDETLPLYGWQEDVDFSARVSGLMLKTNALMGVHCGIKSGREKRGDMLGYSQIANPYYLWRKGSMTPCFALKLCTRNMLSNHLRAFWPEPWVDRRGRARGNWVALFDLLMGRSHPERILNLH